jgi:two-component system, chemotaxis family, CheB/CheR fusion protein
MNGLVLLQRLHDGGHRLPAIMITGNSDAPMAVQTMKAGASDFIEKRIGSIERALEQSRDSNKLFLGGKVLRTTSRGSLSDNARLWVSITKRTGSKSLAALARLALAASSNGAREPIVQDGSPVISGPVTIRHLRGR